MRHILFLPYNQDKLEERLQKLKKTFNSLTKVHIESHQYPSNIFLVSMYLYAQDLFYSSQILHFTS